jgi:hypothetical protein
MSRQHHKLTTRVYERICDKLLTSIGSYVCAHIGLNQSFSDIYALAVWNDPYAMCYQVEYDDIVSMSTTIKDPNQWILQSQIPHFKDATHLICYAPPTKQFYNDVVVYLQSHPHEHVFLHVQGEPRGYPMATTWIEDSLEPLPEVMPLPTNFCSGYMKDIRALCAGNKYTLKTNGIHLLQVQLMVYAMVHIICAKRSDMTLPFQFPTIRMICQNVNEVDHPLFFALMEPTGAKVYLSCTALHTMIPWTPSVTIEWVYWQDNDGYHFPRCNEPHGTCDLKKTLMYNQHWQHYLRKECPNLRFELLNETSLVKNPFHMNLYVFRSIADLFLKRSTL